MIAAVLSVLLLGATAAPQGDSDEDRLRLVVQRYFDAQAREDIDGVLNLWAATAAARPTREALKALFDGGDDRYEIAIRSIDVHERAATVRVSVNRVRTIISDGTPRVYPSTLLTVFTFAREGDDWRISSERPAAEETADTLIAATPAERDRLLRDPDNTTVQVRQAIASRAGRLAIAQQYSASQALFEIALAIARAIHDQRDEGEMLQSIGNSLYFQREYAKAAEYYQERLNLARVTKDDQATAAALLGLATTEYVRGEYTPALGSYRQALDIYERAGTTSSMGSTLVSIGNIQFLQADYDAAARSYRRAVAILEAQVDPGGVAMARSGLARVFAAQGDLASALEMYGKVLEEVRARADPSHGVPGVDPASVLEGIGELHYRLGNTDQARSAFEEARQFYDKNTDFHGAGRVLADLGLTELVAGRFDAALTAYSESLFRYDKAQRPDGIARGWVGIGFSQAAREKYVDAIAAYRTAIGAFEIQGLDEDGGRAWLGLSLALSASGDAAGALESARRSRGLAEKAARDDLRWRAMVREAEALRRLGRLDEAQHGFEEAISFIRRLSADAALSADVRAQLDGSGSAWSGLAFTLAQRGDAAGALAAEEQRRAHLRRLCLAPFERDIVRGTRVEERNAEQQNVRDLISVRAQLRAELSSRHPDQTRLDRLQQETTALTKRRLDQEAELLARVPDLALWRGLQAPPVASDLDTLLPSSTAGRDTPVLIVEYDLSDDELLILSATRNDHGVDAAASIVPINRRELADRIAKVLEPPSLRDAGEWRKRSAPLAEILISPIADRLNGRDRCVFLPDDLLWKIPFEALVLEDKDLASRLRVTYGTSLVTLAVQRKVDEQRPAPERAKAEDVPRLTFAAIAGPEIEPTLRAQLLVTVPGWTPPDPAGSIATARHVAEFYGSGATVMTGADATEDAARALAASADVLQLGAPFQMSGASPLFASVLLAANPTTADEDGRWAIREWFAGFGHASVLVLPDGSSYGAPGSGAGMDALAWAAAAAGASIVALGRWPPELYKTDGVLGAWHERLARSPRTPSDALGDAIRAIRLTDGDAPAAWAGIRMVGGS